MISRTLAAVLVLAACQAGFAQETSDTARPAGDRQQQAERPAVPRDPFAPTDRMLQASEYGGVTGADAGEAIAAVEARLSAKLDAMQKRVEEALSEQAKAITELAARLQDLSDRLASVPPMTLQSAAVDGSGRGVALLEIGGVKQLVRSGDVIQLTPRENLPVQMVRVVDIQASAVLVEVGPWQDRVVVR